MPPISDRMKYVLLFLGGGLINCRTGRIMLEADRCLNSPVDLCEQAADPKELSRPAEIRVYQLKTPVDPAVMSFDALLTNDEAALKPHLLTRLEVTILPGTVQPLEVALEKDTRYLLFFFAGRQPQYGEKHWFTLVKRPLFKEYIYVSLKGFEIRIVEKGAP